MKTSGVRIGMQRVASLDSPSRLLGPQKVRAVLGLNTPEKSDTQGTCIGYAPQRIAYNGRWPWGLASLVVCARAGCRLSCQGLHFSTLSTYLLMFAGPEVE